ncbi:WhiB family transcriptional regulator [Actinacidiphila yeochonensis]|uniref:WhiB family transcriptional regulator n=1 Tax=Actinacidiphila yeochonensis TaxID=89050 RepID=UPI00056401C7|nr:WhiB family transcriptional regulator [Actinacidiphila yeochonensis]
MSSSDITEAAPQIPFPRSDTPTACQKNPGRFSHEKGGAQGFSDTAVDIRRAKRDCAQCPLVTDCLKWALANPALTRVGVWAATTPRERTALRKRQVERLGPDWVAKVAAADRRRAERRQRARTNPPPIRETALDRLALELIPTRPEPYEPWRGPITPERAMANRHTLARALGLKKVA